VSEPALQNVATYERTVAASLERVWENVLDWEHLPSLHASSFRWIERIGSGPWGWSARVGLPRGESRIELLVDRAAAKYVTRTTEGRGAGSEVWTNLEVLDAEHTAVRVEFWLPAVAAERARELGARYVALYTRLWDEDESMMRRRERMLRELRNVRAREAVVELGSAEALLAALPLRVEFAGRPWRIVRSGDELIVHSAVCPHMLGPLDQAPVEDGSVRCPWHGYRFALATGRCEGRAYRLAAPPRLEIEGGSARLVPARS
jgi:nitrite reductase/ring-hydroxylating ferredoxin subunit